MKSLGLEHLWEVLDAEPEFYVHSIANRRDRILVVELYTHIYIYISLCFRLVAASDLKASSSF